MTHSDEQQARIDALAEEGWVLVHQQPERVEATGDGLMRRADGLYRFERNWRGSTFSEIGATLDQALDAAEWSQARIASLADAPVSVHDGHAAR